MPRSKRLDIAGVAQHVVQRGNDRQPCFFRGGDQLRYLQDLREAALKFDCRIHAYVLMTNHVHLLVTPGAVGMVGRMMQTVGRRYVRYVNDSLGRTGTLWEGRYKSCLVDSESYVLECYRYIELMVATEQDYLWSSFGHNGLGRNDPLIHPHEVYEWIDQDPEKRYAEYRHLVGRGSTRCTCAPSDSMCSVNAPWVPAGSKPTLSSNSSAARAWVSQAGRVGRVAPGNRNFDLGGGRG